MKQMSARWYEWSRYTPGRRLDEHGHFLAGEDGQPGTIVNPVAFHEGDREQVAELGGAGAVLLTSAVRTDEARRCAETLGCPVIDAFADQAVELPGGLVALTVSSGAAADDPSAPAREVALYHEDTLTAVVGASVVGSPAGALSLAGHERQTPLPNVLPVVAARTPGANESSAAARTARALRGLLAGRVRMLLVGAGTSLLHEPARALQDLVYRHDPAAMIVRQDDLCWDPPTGAWTLGTRFGARFAEYAALMGLQTLDFDLTDVPPGKQSGQLHRHDGEEELFVILAGRGELLTEHGAYPVQAGDVVGFPPRYQIAHAWRNTGDGPFRYLAFGAPSERLEMLDYPETNIRAESARYGKRHRFILPQERSIPYWEGVRTE